ncbi:5711_t:CDS:1, partial [Funneliformis geosporum]
MAGEARDIKCQIYEKERKDSKSMFGTLIKCAKKSNRDAAQS